MYMAQHPKRQSLSYGIGFISNALVHMMGLEEEKYKNRLFTLTHKICDLFLEIPSGTVNLIQHVFVFRNRSKWNLLQFHQHLWPRHQLYVKALSLTQR
jgi:hypothetical protein